MTQLSKLWSENSAALDRLSHYWSASYTGGIASTNIDRDTRASFVNRSKIHASSDSPLRRTVEDEFNTHFRDFGMEHPRNNVRNVAVSLNYKILLLHDIYYPGAFSTEQEWAESVDVFYLKTFEELHRLRPDLDWALIEVTGDGNCFFHGGAANQVISERTQIRHHYYAQLRNLSCDVLRDSIDDGPKKQTGDLSFMHYYQTQCMSGVTTDAIQPHPDIYMDYLGEIKPQKKKEQSDKSFEEEKMAFPALLIERKAIVRRRILEHIEATRTHGSFNTEQQILGFAILTSTRVKALYFDGERTTVRYEFTPDNCTNPSDVIMMIMDARIEGGEHWITAVSLDSLNGFKAPLDPPKTTRTHDERGLPKPKRTYSNNFAVINGQKRDRPVAVTGQKRGRPAATGKKRGRPSSSVNVAAGQKRGRPAAATGKKRGRPSSSVNVAAGQKISRPFNYLDAFFESVF